MQPSRARDVSGIGLGPTRGEEVSFVRDAANALRILNPGGTLLFHDCKPLLPPEGAFPMAPGTVYWNGTVRCGVARSFSFSRR